MPKNARRREVSPGKKMARRRGPRASDASAQKQLFLVTKLEAPRSELKSNQLQAHLDPTRESTSRGIIYVQKGAQLGIRVKK